MNNRKFKRDDSKLGLRYHFFDTSVDSMDLGSIENFSAGGLQATLAKKALVGQRIRFSVEKNNHEWLPEVDGIVVWQKFLTTNLYLTGISFSPDQNLFKLDQMGNAKERDWTSSNHSLSDHASEVECAYDGSRVTYKLLRLFGWGPLNNLGYFRFPSPLESLNAPAYTIMGSMLHMLPDAQRSLILHSLRELDVQKGEKVLDVACGKGMSSFLIASMYPETIVTGIDILSGNVDASRAVYGGAHNLRFFVDNAMAMDIADNSLNKIMCVEAAFHFPDKQKFLKEVFRVLKPGGRFVLVDFVWKDSSWRVSADDSVAQLVKDEWQWNDFFSQNDYVEAFETAGLKIERELDWSRNVIDPLGHVFLLVSRLGNTSFGRSILNGIHPQLKSLNRHEWKRLLESALGHDYIRTRIKYMTYVLRKENFER